MSFRGFFHFGHFVLPICKSAVTCQRDLSSACFSQKSAFTDRRSSQVEPIFQNPIFAKIVSKFGTSNFRLIFTD